VLRAGAGLCAGDAVKKLSEEGPDRIRQLLLDDGSDGVFANVPFDRDENGELLYCLEASHSAPRIIHFADQSGKAITEHITEATASHPLIEIVPNTIVTDLITSDVPDPDHSNNLICLGVQCFDKKTKTLSNQFSTRGTVLATGGTCGIYEHSTNPSGFNALGSSIALAVRANADVADLEYIQFHPTSLYIPGEERFLLTEALRGSGAKLRDASGYAFAKEFHQDGELAPRDVVARGVYERLQQTTSSQKHNVFLDIRHRDPAWLRQRFPSIQQYLNQRGLDLTKDLLPITPAAHYTCGGVVTDLNGRTSVLGLYAAGEAARTGVHGGNRLASTSLLEGLVFGASVADYVGLKSERETALARDAISQLLSLKTSNTLKMNSPHAHSNSKAASFLLQILRQTMWDKVGVVRTHNEIENAHQIISTIVEESNELFEEVITPETAGLRDAAFAAREVAVAALINPVSKGAHYRVPDESDDEQDEQQLERLAS